MVYQKLLIEESGVIDSRMLGTKSLAFLKLQAAESQGGRLLASRVCASELAPSWWEALPVLAISPALCTQHPWSWYLKPGSAGLRQSPPWGWKLVGSGIPARLQLRAGKPREYQLNKRLSLEYLV